MAEETRRRYEVTSVSSVHFFITHIYTYTCHNADAAELRLDVCVIKKWPFVFWPHLRNYLFSRSVKTLKCRHFEGR